MGGLSLAPHPRPAVGLQDGECVDAQRFAFGKNWSRFLRLIDEDRIAVAERSLQTALKLRRLDGLSFLDVGSGSGLFSLAARRLGATVRSFDCDPASVACTQELQRRYHPDGSCWTIEHGSVLDSAYLGRLGTFDIVYAWGVLHHTGNMWQALSSLKPLVSMGGRLFISVYNDLGEVTDAWAQVKRRHGRLPRPLAAAYATGIVAKEESRTLADQWQAGGIGGWVRSWTQYGAQSARGMSKWHDWIDWIGGYPYERAKIVDVVDRCTRDGFRLLHLLDRSRGYGCNEFVFAREAPLGTQLDCRIPGGTSLAWRFGHALPRPFQWTPRGWVSELPDAVLNGSTESLWLFRSDRLLGPAQFDASGRLLIADPDAGADQARTFVMRGEVRAPAAPFTRGPGHTWVWEAPDLADRADGSDRPARSGIAVLQDGEQLPYPHALHRDIAAYGNGRFSHWGSSIYFAPRGNGDPGAEPHRFSLFIPSE